MKGKYAGTQPFSLIHWLFKSHYSKLFRFESTENVPYFKCYFAYIKEHKSNGQIWTCEVSLMTKTESGIKNHYSWSLLKSVWLRGTHSVIVQFVDGQECKFKFATKLERKCFLWNCVDKGHLIPQWKFGKLVKFMSNSEQMQTAPKNQQNENDRDHDERTSTNKSSSQSSDQSKLCFKLRKFLSSERLYQ